MKTKYENGDGPAKMYRNLTGTVSLSTIKLWRKMISTTGSITVSSSPDCSRTVCATALVFKVKNRLNKKRMSTRKLAKEMNISRRSIHQILHKDLGCKLHKKTKQLKLTNSQKKIIIRGLIGC